MRLDHEKIKIEKDKVYKDTQFIHLKKGDVRIMFDDGKGMLAMDFENPGKVNQFLKDFVYNEFKEMQKKDRK